MNGGKAGRASGRPVLITRELGGCLGAEVVGVSVCVCVCACACRCKAQGQQTGGEGGENPVSDKRTWIPPYQLSICSLGLVTGRVSGEVG